MEDGDYDAPIYESYYNALMDGSDHDAPMVGVISRCSQVSHPGSRRTLGTEAII